MKLNGKSATTLGAVVDQNAPGDAHAAAPAGQVPATAALAADRRAAYIAGLFEVWKRRVNVYKKTRLARKKHAKRVRRLKLKAKTRKATKASK